MVMMSDYFKWGQKKVGEIQTSASAFDIFQQSMGVIHQKNQIVVDEHQEIIDAARLVQDSAASEVKKAENFKTNLAKMFDTPVE